MIDALCARIMEFYKSSRLDYEVLSILSMDLGLDKTFTEVQTKQQLSDN